MLVVKASPPTENYPSYDDCLEDKRADNQNCSVLYCVSQLCQLYTHSYEQVLHVNCFMYYLVVLWLSVPAQLLPEKTRLQNDLLCVKRDVKLHSLFTIKYMPESTVLEKKTCSSVCSCN